MGDLPYISSEQVGGLIMRITYTGAGHIIHHGLIIRTIRYTPELVSVMLIIMTYSTEKRTASVKARPIGI